MKSTNPQTIIINPAEGLIIPLKFCSQTEKSLYEQRYERLQKSSHKYIVRLGIPSVV